MGTTSSEQRAPYVERLTLALILPRFLIVGQALLLGSLSLAIIGVVGLMHFSSVPDNPFAVYADIFPGQALHALDAHGFTCTYRDYNYYNDPAETRCNLSPKTGTFSNIEAFYSGGVIHRLTFEIRDFTLNIGDPAVLLDLTELRPQGSVLFTWQGNIGIAQPINPTNRRFTVLRRVWQVTLTDARLDKP